MTERPELHVVDAATGELRAPDCPQCEVLAGQNAGLERDIRGWRHRYRELERDVELEAREHPHWDAAVELFDYWRETCDHTRSRFTAERFQMVEPFIEKDGVDVCRKAIAGAAFDPFTQRRRNGTVKRFDDFDLIFRSRAKFEEFCARAPNPPDPTYLYQVATEILGRMPEDDRPSIDRVHDAVAQAREALKHGV